MNLQDVLKKFVEFFSSPLTDKAVVEFEKYLRDMDKDMLNQALSEVINVNGLVGGTALHIAIQRNSIQAVKMLISFDAPIDTLISGKKPLELAQELIETTKGPEQENMKNIFALLQTRKSWTKYGHKHGIPFNRAIQLLERGMEILPMIDREVVLIYGQTQRGKSTFVNYLQGTDYDVVTANQGELRKYAKRRNGSTPEVMQVGGGRLSETVYPQITFDVDPSYAIVDMPGFGDMRGEEDKVCVRASNRLLERKLNGQKVRGILLVVAYGDLTEGGNSNLLETMAKIYDIIKEVQGHLFLVVTQAPSGIKDFKPNVRGELARIYAVNEQQSARSPQDRMRFKAGKVMTDILSRQNSIINGDVSIPDARNETIAILSTLTSLPSNSFNFSVYGSNDGSMEKFKLSVEEVIAEYFSLSDKQKSLEEAIRILTGEIADKEKHINGLKTDKNLLVARIHRPFVKQDSSIKEAQTLLDKLLGAEHILALKIAELEAEIERLKKEIVDIDNDESWTLLTSPISFKAQQKMNHDAVSKEDEEVEINYHLEVERELRERKAALDLYTQQKAEYDKVLAERNAHDSLGALQKLLLALPPNLPPMPVLREDRPFPLCPEAIDPNVAQSHKYNLRHNRAMEKGRVKQFCVEYKLPSGKAIKHFEVEADHCVFSYGKWKDGEFITFEKDSAEYRSMLEQGIIHLSFDGEYRQEGVLYQVYQGEIGVVLKVLGLSRDSEYAISLRNLKKDKLLICEEKLIHVRYVLKLVKEDIASYNDKIALLEGEEGAVNQERERLKGELHQLDLQIEGETKQVQSFRQRNTDDGVEVLNCEAMLSQETYMNLYVLLQTLQLHSDMSRKYLSDSRFAYEKHTVNSQTRHEHGHQVQGSSESRPPSSSFITKRFFHSERELHPAVNRSSFYALSHPAALGTRKTMTPTVGFSGISFYVPRLNISVVAGESTTNKLLTTVAKTAPVILRRIIR